MAAIQTEGEYTESWLPCQSIPSKHLILLWYRTNAGQHQPVIEPAMVAGYHLHVGDQSKHAYDVWQWRQGMAQISEVSKVSSGESAGAASVDNNTTPVISISVYWCTTTQQLQKTSVSCTHSNRGVIIGIIRGIIIYGPSLTFLYHHLGYIRKLASAILNILRLTTICVS